MSEGVVIRSARIEDAPAIARVHVAAWRDTYPGVLPASYLVGLSAAGETRQWRALLTRPGRAGTVLLAETARQAVLGYGSCGRQRTALRGIDGEFYALYVHPACQERGVGRRLMAAMAQRLLEQQMRSACVWFLRDNPARWFYGRLGGRLAAETQIRFAGQLVQQQAYVWADAAALARLAEADRRPADP